MFSTVEDIINHYKKQREATPMRPPSEDEMGDYAEQEAIERFRKEQYKKRSRNDGLHPLHPDKVHFEDEMCEKCYNELLFCQCK